MHRFRTGENGELVLQVGAYKKRDMYDHHSADVVMWRDATVADIPVADPFARQLDHSSLAGLTGRAYSLGRDED